MIEHHCPKTDQCPSQRIPVAVTDRGIDIVPAEAVGQLAREKELLSDFIDSLTRGTSHRKGERRGHGTTSVRGERQGGRAAASKQREPQIDAHMDMMIGCDNLYLFGGYGYC